MDAEYFEFEELGVSEPVGLAFHGFDFVVRAFQRRFGVRAHLVLQQDFRFDSLVLS